MTYKLQFNPEMAIKYGGHRRQACLSEKQILAAYSRYHAGETCRKLGKEFGVSKSAIHNIATGRFYSDITGHKAS